jgi:hypothetical protein
LIVLFTDFGLHGPYTGQMKAVDGHVRKLLTRSSRQKTQHSQQLTQSRHRSRTDGCQYCHRKQTPLGSQKAEREVEGFTQDASNTDFDTTLAKAVDCGAPVCFLKKRETLGEGDWKRLTLRQRVIRWSLWRGSYVHADGTIELSASER